MLLPVVAFKKSMGNQYNGRHGAFLLFPCSFFLSPPHE